MNSEMAFGWFASDVTVGVQNNAVKCLLGI